MMCGSRCFRVSLPAVVAFMAMSSYCLAEPADSKVDYLKQVKPLLSTKCFACHGALKQEAGMRLDAASLIRKGGDTGVVIQPGKPELSLLLQRVTSSDAETRMPPKGEGEPLDADQIAILRSWIEQGAEAPDEAIPADPRTHWSFQAPRKSAVPAVDRQPWMRNEIDAFVADVHRQRGLVPVSRARKETLLRRVYLDLIGLPPTRAELQAFLKNDSPHALEDVVDDLLQRTGHGERWGRHWMDIWRYSDWAGFGNEMRYSQKYIWRWRDWIIESINADKGYDRMIVEMLAGDEAAPDDETVLRATGFLARNWYKFDRNVWMDDTVQHTAKAFLGLTLNCCRCHDHKYDPISQHEYYAFRAIFEPYDVRTERVAGQLDIAQDGLVRVYDAKPTEATFLFSRGDAKQPVKDKPIAPAVPSVVGGSAYQVAEVAIPLLGYFPDLREHVVNDLIAQKRAAVTSTEAAVASARKAVDVATQELAAVKTTAVTQPSKPQTPAQPKPPESKTPKAVTAESVTFLIDDFEKSRPDTWTVRRGDWSYRDGRVVQENVAASFSPMVTVKRHPQDFAAELSFKTTGGNTYRSVGFSFDEADDKHHQAVYVSLKGGGSTVSAFHRTNGVDNYPPNGVVPCRATFRENIKLEVLVRDQVLNIRVNGEFALAYRMPVARQAGKFAIWTYDASAEFDRLAIRQLSKDVPLKPPGSDTPTTVAENQQPQPTDFAAKLELAQAKQVVTEKQLATARAQLTEVTAQVAAERTKYGLVESDKPTSIATALAAGNARQQAVVALADEVLAKSEFDLKTARLAPDKNAAKAKSAIDAAQKKIAPAKQALAAARKAAGQPSEAYTALGTSYARTSTGRRLALARWITDRSNPLTARVAVNHVWTRHFGSPLVERVDDFGLRSPQPTHIALLDYLANFLMDNNWSLKKLHRLIVTSGVYALESGVKNAPAGNAKLDPDNEFLWRANSRRMQAEVIRDSIFSASSSLDRKTGGAEIARDQGESNTRRSVYFQHARQRQMQFLEMFDGANPRECYRRKQSVRPQQAFTMINSSLTLAESRLLASKIKTSTNDDFVQAAFETILSRGPSTRELATCREFLNQQAETLSAPSKLQALGTTVNRVPPSADPIVRARENLVLVLFNHNDFVTIR
ncbi:MAG: DUF1553 domain-containing protein [Planctomycetota bacterium]|nr:DUF1553 domain-containing protein [Planctomycetota bacterium]